MLTPGTHAGAIGMFWLHAHDAAGLRDAMRVMKLGEIAVGAVGLRSLFGIDDALVARVDERSLLLMPHGSVAGARAIARELQALFGEAAESVASARLLFAEARSEVEARAMVALASAPSKLAVDALMAQHALWSEAGAVSDAGRDAVMRHLLVPAVVVAMGASNIGKSTLVNALAKRHVSIVADEPGTTRDHVGVMIDCGGLTVQYVDTPGLRETSDVEEIAARERALQLAARADLLLLCGDAEHEPPDVSAKAGQRVLRVALRADRGGPAWRADVTTCARSGSGLAELVAAIRETLVPEAVLRARIAWRFWD